MIVSVFSPFGIVTVTASHDSFSEMRKEEDEAMIHRINIKGLPHVYTFWEKYVLVYNCINQNICDVRMPYCLSSLVKKWDSAPAPQEFMPYLKKLIVDNHIQIIGVVSAYYGEDQIFKTPYVYQILGDDIRRVNIDNSGNLNYNCIYLEKNPIVGKLLRQSKLLNGDTWEEQDECRFRFDLFSVSRAIDFSVFAVKTNYFINNIDTSEYCDPLCMDVAVVTPEGIDIVQKKY